MPPRSVLAARISVCLFSLIPLAGYAVAARGQAVSPAVEEYSSVLPNKAVEGHFDVANDTMEPLAVTIEAKSFNIDRKGTAVFSRLNADIQLQLSATSLRLPPKQHRTIYYKISSASAPAWFCIYSTFSGLPRRNGVSVQLDLPHTVYLHGKSKPGPADLQFASLHRDGNVLRGVLHNNSPDMLRVLALEASSAHAKVSEGGFPILPGGEHEFTVTVDKQPFPDHVRARFSNFHVDGTVQ